MIYKIMKLITLNMWLGRVAEPLTKFLNEKSGTDIFLFQEIVDIRLRNNAQAQENAEKVFEVGKILTGHNSYFAPAKPDGFGLASFVKKGIEVKEEESIFIHKDKDAMVDKDWTTVGKNMQYIKIVSGGKNYSIFNLHGLWIGTGKFDTEERIKQSEKIIEFIKKFDGNKILCGDFNLRPDTKSIKMIEDELGLRNLVTEYGVPTTRTSLYTKTEEKFADYIFVSPGIEVLDFKVLPEEVSDHAALYLEFK